MAIVQGRWAEVGRFRRRRFRQKKVFGTSDSINLLRHHPNPQQEVNHRKTTNKLIKKKKGLKVTRKRDTLEEGEGSGGGE